MTATNIFYNFVGFRYSPPFKIYTGNRLGGSADSICSGARGRFGGYQPNPLPYSVEQRY